jgi:UTP:GlnB (protein PII) uridylyltransferase
MHTRFLLALAVFLVPPVLAQPLPVALTQLSQHLVVVGASRPTTDGQLDWDRVEGDLVVLDRLIPGFAAARALRATSAHHPHTVGEHGLRALAFFLETPYARSLSAKPRPFFVASLTTLLHDMGKLASPRDRLGRQLPDEAHPSRSKNYAMKYGRTLGLTAAETAWMARMMDAHEALGMTDRYYRVPGTVSKAELAQYRSELKRAVHSVDDLNYLEAFTEADVWGANGHAYHDWKMATRIPAMARRLSAEFGLSH